MKVEERQTMANETVSALCVTLNQETGETLRRARHEPLGRVEAWVRRLAEDMEPDAGPMVVPDTHLVGTLYVCKHCHNVYWEPSEEQSECKDD